MVLLQQCYRGGLIALMFLLGLIAVKTIMPGIRKIAGVRTQNWCDAIVLKWNRTACRILNLDIKISGRPDSIAGLTVANHVSWLDIIAIGSLQPLTFVSKAEVANWPVMGQLAKGIGTVFIRRGDSVQAGAVCEDMARMLRQGQRLMLFPEGTTTRGDRVLRFHGKLFQPAQAAGSRIQTLALRYRDEAAGRAPFVGDDQFLPHLLGILALKRIELEIHYCPALPNGLRRDQIARVARLQIVEKLQLTEHRREPHFDRHRTITNYSHTRHKPTLPLRQPKQAGASQ